MLILWIRKNKNSEINHQQDNNEKPFQEHDEEMKKFMNSHPKLETENSQETTTVDDCLLARVQGVKLAKHIQN